MTSARRPQALEWVLLCALAFSVLGMHHVSEKGPHHQHGAPAAAEAEHSGPSAGCCEVHPAVMAPTDHCPTCDHDTLHLCLAVLVAIVALTLRRLRRGVLSISARRPLHLAVIWTARGPAFARRAPDVLASLCILRL